MQNANYSSGVMPGMILLELGAILYIASLRFFQSLCEHTVYYSEEGWPNLDYSY